MTLDATNWRAPYRTMDASGSPEAAAVIGSRWIEAIARREYARDPAGVWLNSGVVGSDGSSEQLWRGNHLIAAAVVMRDQMNFSVLIRWLAPGMPEP